MACVGIRPIHVPVWCIRYHELHEANVVYSVILVHYLTNHLDIADIDDRLRYWYCQDFGNRGINTLGFLCFNDFY